ncbi:MAG: hypothetical protein RSF37_09835 [Clostridium sp.]|uniref:hypothetical protein n=1 Tax=Clostridium sp. TaxID=1506 RepID=UPI002FCC049F
MDEYETNNSIYLKRAIIGYYQDFAEYIIDMCEIYLVRSDTYVDGCSSLEIIKRSSIHGFINENLSRFLVGVVRLRNN